MLECNEAIFIGLSAALHDVVIAFPVSAVVMYMTLMPLRFYELTRDFHLVMSAK